MNLPSILATAVLATAGVLLPFGPFQDGAKPLTPPPAPQGKPEPKPAGGQEGGKEGRGEHRGRGREHEEEETPLSETMEKIDHAMHFLRKSLNDPNQDAASLDRIVAAQSAALACKALAPKMLPHVPEEKRAKFLVDYKKNMGDLLIELIHLEQQVLDGERKDAIETYKALDLMKDDAHNTFTEGD